MPSGVKLHYSLFFTEKEKKGEDMFQETKGEINLPVVHLVFEKGPILHP